MPEVGLTLNKDKCHFSQHQWKFLGQLIDRDGVHPDHGKVQAIHQFKIPQNVGDFHRFLGMCNHLSKFAPNLADKIKPLRELLHKNQWVWGEPQRTGFKEIKETLTTSPVVALFDQTRDTVGSADVSSDGLGTVFLPDGELKSTSYISRLLTPAEQRYAQSEKKALAFTWACKWFNDFLLGMEFHIYTDHKLLVPLFNTKNLDELPIPVQQFRLRMM